MNLHYHRVVYPGQCAGCGVAFDCGDECLVNNVGTYYCTETCAQLDQDRADIEADHEADLGEQLYGPQGEDGA